MYPPSSSFLLPVFQCAQSRTPKANMVHVTQWPASSFFLSFSSKKHAKYARGGWRREERKKVPGRLSEETGIVSCGLSECPVSPPTGGGLGSGGHGAQPGPAWELGLGSGVCWPGGGQGQPRVGWGLGGLGARRLACHGARQPSCLPARWGGSQGWGRRQRVLSLSPLILQGPFMGPAPHKGWERQQPRRRPPASGRRTVCTESLHELVLLFVQTTPSFFIVLIVPREDGTEERAPPGRRGGGEAGLLSPFIIRAHAAH